MLNLYYCSISQLMKDSFLRQQTLGKLQKRRQEKVQRFAYLDDQCRSIAAGLCLRQALLDQKVAYGKCLFSEGAKGKLSLEGNDSLCFNLSHSGNYGICLMADRPVGVDLESLAIKNKKIEQLDKIAERNFTEEEYDFFRTGSDEEEKRFRFVRVFTGKEAYGKLLGVGIGYQMKEYSVLDNERIYSFLFDDYMISIAAENPSPQELKLIEVCPDA